MLGPLQAQRDGEAIGIRPGHTQRVLCALVSRANEYVSVAELIDAQWPDDPPSSAQQNTRRAVHWLRRALGGPQTIVRGPAGYRIRLDEGQFDKLEFGALLEKAQRAHRHERWGEAAELYSSALRLWRGKPYAGLADSPFLRPEVQRLAELRTQALEGRATVRLALGQHAELLPELAGLVEEDVVHERLVALYMRALHAAGRLADAQAVFWRTKQRLSEELGADPTPELQEVYDAIVSGSLPAPKPPAATAKVPAQLPTDVFGFVGRRTELDQLRAAAALSTNESAAVIATISGTAGVGKTTLAVHWTHEAAHRFPDGQLYLNLRGFDATGTVTPGDALRRCLDALGVAPAQIPVDLESQAALYRTQLTGKRALVVLDNARDTDHVRLLLPGSAGCVAVVTSRNDLTGLVVKEGARPLRLGLLSEAEARELLQRRLGWERVAAEPDAFEEIVAAGAGLPLALAILAARAVTHPEVSLRELADDLRATRQNLTGFSGADDPGADVRQVFSWSHDRLTPAAARVFRLLGLHPGPDIAASAVASHVGLPPGEAEPLLGELVQANLLAQHTTGRYGIHDLLRVYTSELSTSYDSEDERRTTVLRLLDHYLHTAFAADRLLLPARTSIDLAPPTALAAPQRLTGLDQAMSWFTAERLVLYRVLDLAVSWGFDTHAWQLAWALNTFLLRRGFWLDRATCWRKAVDAARRLGDRAVQALVLRGSANALVDLERFDEAREQLQRVLDLDAEVDDPTGRAHTHRSLGRLFYQQGKDLEALDHFQRALELFRATNEAHGEAVMLNAVGYQYVRVGDYERARACCEEALALLQALGIDSELAATWDSLGYVHRHLGDHEQAIACYENALALYKKLGSRPLEANAYVHLGDVSELAGESEAARRAWQQALAILDDHRLPEAEAVRAKLAGLAQRS